MPLLLVLAGFLALLSALSFRRCGQYGKAEKKLPTRTQEEVNFLANQSLKGMPWFLTGIVAAFAAIILSVAGLVS
ncbi:hypothetical protein EPN83_01810 [Patescibacteria group bacterium]|nr:MAG: hypothetical protein EPN83_01810 [Patescibacteria group bacterium]